MNMRILRSILIGFTVVFCLASNAQKVNPAIIENVPESYAWNIVYQSFKKHNKKLGNYNQQTQTANSGYYRYTNLVADNRAKYQVTYINGSIEIKFVDKQYLTKEGWVNNLFPVTKGIKKKYIYPITKTIRELNEKISANTPPFAVFTFNPSSGGTTTQINFDASACHDAEEPNSSLKVRWDWENDGNWDTQWMTQKTAQHRYTKQDVFTVKMGIMDSYGATSEAIHKLSIKNYSSCTGQPFVTYKGQTYNTVLIGNQCWLKENLNVGLMIDGSEVMENNGMLEKYCYNNDVDNCAIYGGLYQWNELMKYTSKDSIGICPDGWKIPSKDDFQTLKQSLGGMEVAGSKLKEAVSIRWSGQSHPATNESGFTVIPGGFRGDNGIFEAMGNTAYFATSNSSSRIVLQHNSHQAQWENAFNNRSVSVRCIKSKIKEEEEKPKPSPSTGKGDKSKKLEEPIFELEEEPNIKPSPKPEDGAIVNVPPIPCFEVDPKKGTICDVFTFDASCSTDFEDPIDSLRYCWFFDWGKHRKYPDKAWNNKNKVVHHKYTQPDDHYIIRLGVMDTKGEKRFITRKYLVVTDCVVSSGPIHPDQVTDTIFRPDTPIISDSFPPQTNCPKKEYLIYFPFNNKGAMDSINNIASRGYKLKAASIATFYFEKEENDNGIYPIKILDKILERMDIREFNALAKDKWVVLNSFFMTYLIQDETAPQYEYKFGTELSNSYMGNYKHYLPGGSNIQALNYMYGDYGWELVQIAGNSSLFRRIIGSNIKYKYKSLVLTANDKRENFKRVQELGEAGWQYCTQPNILKGKTGQNPIILKQRVGMGDVFSFQVVLINNPNTNLPQYFSLVGKPEKEKQMVEAYKPWVWSLNNFGQAGWVYEMFIEAEEDIFGEDKYIIVFQVPASCR